MTQVQASRELVRDCALAYERTPYHAAGRVKGVGVDCLTFIVGVYEDAQLIPKQNLPHYNALWHLHKEEEKYIEAITRYCFEFNREQDVWRNPQTGDLILYKMGRCFSHAVVVLEWPTRVIHARFLRNVYCTDPRIDADLRGRPRRFFTFWKDDL